MEPCLGTNPQAINLEICFFAVCNIPGKMIDYKQKYIESSAEVNDQAAGGSTEDHGQADEKLEGDQDTEAARRPSQPENRRDHSRTETESTKLTTLSG
jgi:hypothetical protein